MTLDPRPVDPSTLDKNLHSSWSNTTRLRSWAGAALLLFFVTKTSQNL